MKNIISKTNAGKLFLVLIGLTWLPAPFVGFNSHHDGLMLVTVKQMHQAIQNGGPWPFNQYGPLWIFVYTIFTWNIPSEYLLILMRIIALLCYFLTAIIVYRIGKIVGGNQVAFIATLVLLGNEAFAFHMLPWPSAIAMPVIALASLLLVKLLESFSTTKSVSKSQILFLGLLLAIVLFTRVQIGILLTVASVLVLSLAKIPKAVFRLLVGFFASVILSCLYLQRNHWLGSALKDSYVYGSRYFSNEYNPKPLYTLIGVIFFMIFFAISERIIQYINYKKIFYRFLMIAIMSILGIIFICYKILLARNMSLYGIYSLIIDRTWISLIFSGIIFFFFEQSITTYRFHKLKLPLERNVKTRNAIAIFALVAQIQVYPLFDRMHSWWGSVPGVVVVAILISERLEKVHLSSLKKEKILLYIFSLIVVFIVTPIIFQARTGNIRMTDAPYSTILVEPEQAKELENVQFFLDNNIPKNSKILNICSDADVFFSDSNREPSSRFFIYWFDFKSVTYIRDEMLRNRPDYLLICKSRAINKISISSESFRETIILRFPKSRLIATLIGSPDTTWEVWKVI